MSKLRTFRLVCADFQIDRLLEFLAAEGFESEPLPLSPFCRLSSSEPQALGSSLAAFFGLIYIQDKSSMLPPLALKPPAGASVLDLCASPGGKSSFLAQLVGENGFVLANEPPGQRLGTLRANVLRASLPQLATCVHDGRQIPLRTGSWSHILLDAPCSGWGTVEKNPQAAKIWRGKKITPLIALQRSLLLRAASLLTPGGLLLYSTCTTNPDENEAQIERAGELGLNPVPIAPFAGFEFDESLRGCLRINGGASGAQGFFLALLQKAGANPPAADCPAQNSPSNLSPVDVEPFLKLPPGGVAALFGETARFLPAPSARVIPPDFTWQGYPLGKMPGGHFLPQARLRAFWTPKGNGTPALQLDTPAEIRSLLSGSAKNTSLPGNIARLYWRDLPLGYVGLKNGRPIPAFK